MVIVTNPHREIEKVIVRKESPKEQTNRLKIDRIKERNHNAKSLIGYIRGCLAIARTDKNSDLEWIYQDLLNKQAELDKIKAQINLNKAHGKSTFELLRRPDYIEIITYQKIDDEVKEIVTTISKEEFNGVIIALNNLAPLSQYISTKSIAGEYCKIMKIERDDDGEKLFDERGFRWKIFFSWRTMHTKLNLMLRALSELKLIEYRGRRAKIISDKLSIQTIFT